MTKTILLAVIATAGLTAGATAASAYESHHHHMMRQHRMMHRHVTEHRHGYPVGDAHSRQTATGGNPGGYSSRN